MDRENNLTDRNFADYFYVSSQIALEEGASKDPNADFDSYISSPEKVTNKLELPEDFIPRDMDYHELDEEMTVIALCGGNAVTFVYLFKPYSKIVSIPQKYHIEFPGRDANEELLVIKSGLLYLYHERDRDNSGSKFEEIFATAGKSGVIHLYKIRPEEKRCINFSHFQAHLNRINDLCFAPSHSRPELRNILLSCSDDGSIMAWDLGNSSAVLCLKPNKAPLDNILSIDWADSGDEIIAAHLDAVRIWPIERDTLKFLGTRTTDFLKGKKLQRKEIYHPKVIVKNFHDYYIDVVKYFSNKAIMTKSVNGQIFIWTYDQKDSDDPQPIILAKYETLSSLAPQNLLAYGMYKPTINIYDNLVVVPGESKVRIFHPRNRDDKISYKLIHLSQQKTHVLKAMILDNELDFLFILTKEGHLWHHRLEELELEQGEEGLGNKVTTMKI